MRRLWKLLKNFKMHEKVDIMAGHSDSSSSEKKSSEAMTNVPIFSAENMQNNMKVIYYRFAYDIVHIF
ncbi:hypothetical protein V6N13_050867 [Hibiscus sabdariffa]